MSRLTIYVIKEISSSFLFSIILLTGILWLGQSLRHLDLLTSDNVDISAYFSYVFLLLPKIFQLTTPIAFFVSILFVLNRLRSDSELIVLWAAGKATQRGKHPQNRPRPDRGRGYYRAKGRGGADDAGGAAWRGGGGSSIARPRLEGGNSTKRFDPRDPRKGGDYDTEALASAFLTEAAVRGSSAWAGGGGTAVRSA